MGRDETLIEKLRGIFVTREVFDLRVAPLEKIAYTAIATIVLAVLTALVALVIRK